MKNVYGLPNTNVLQEVCVNIVQVLYEVMLKRIKKRKILTKNIELHLCS